jgi:hypothetical protein
LILCGKGSEGGACRPVDVDIDGGDGHVHGHGQCRMYEDC